MVLTRAVCGWTGYGAGPVYTVVGYGPNVNTKYVTTYMRRSITVSRDQSLSYVRRGWKVTW